MKLYVKYTAGCSSSIEPQEQYGEWSSDNYFYVDSVSTKCDSKLCSDEINVCFDAEIGDYIYVLSVHYGDGDSFGYASGKGEIIWAFKNGQIAYEALAVCEKASDNELKFNIKDDDGNDVPVWNHDYDYFSNVETYTVNAFKLEE